MPTPRFVGKFFADFESDPSARFGFGSSDDQACSACLSYLFCEGVERLEVSPTGFRVVTAGGDHSMECDYVPRATLRRLRSVVAVEGSVAAGYVDEFLFEAFGFVAPIKIAFTTSPVEESATLTCDLPVAKKQQIRAAWLADLESRPESVAERPPAKTRPWWRWS